MLFLTGLASFRNVRTYHTDILSYTFKFENCLTLTDPLKDTGCSSRVCHLFRPNHTSTLSVNFYISTWIWGFWKLLPDKCNSNHLYFIRILSSYCAADGLYYYNIFLDKRNRPFMRKLKHDTLKDSCENLVVFAYFLYLCKIM